MYQSLSIRCTLNSFLTKKQHNAAIFEHMIDMWVDNGIELCVHINTRIWHEDQSMSDVVRYILTLYVHSTDMSVYDFSKLMLWRSLASCSRYTHIYIYIYIYIYILLIQFYFDERSDCLTEVAEMTRTLIEHLNLII